jgi:hypothetical protein
MNPECASNALGMLCHSWFRECKEVEDAANGGGSVSSVPNLPLGMRGEAQEVVSWKRCREGGRGGDRVCPSVV